MNRKWVDGLWMTALLSACALGFYPIPAAVQDEPLGPQAAPQETSALRRRPAPRRSPLALVSHEFVDADLVYVVKVLAKEMGRNVYIGPGVEGSVTMTFKSVPADGALAMVLKAQNANIGYKLIGYNTLIVAAPDKIDQIDNEITGKSFGPRPHRGVMRQEILLEKAPAAKVIKFLQGQYKDVEFIPHPTRNGFYAVGRRGDILQIRNDMPQLDRAPDAPVRMR